MILFSLPGCIPEAGGSAGHAENRCFCTGSHNLSSYPYEPDGQWLCNIRVRYDTMVVGLSALSTEYF